MPWASKSQEKWGNSPTGVKALGGAKKVQEWNAATDQKSLPDKKAPGALLAARKKKSP